MFPVAGNPDDTAHCTSVTAGTRTGQVGAGRGFNAGALRTSDALGFGTGAQIVLTARRFRLRACSITT